MRLSLLLLFLPTTFIVAQSAFLKNPDIVWAAEIEQDWVVDIPSLEVEWEYGITTLKLMRTEKNYPYWNSTYLADLIFEAALRGEFPVFKDPQCRIPVDIMKVYPSKDTVITYDPETYEEKRQVYIVEPFPFRDFKAWRLRQVLAYHAKSASWSTTVEAIAPLVAVRNEAWGDSIGLRPLFWFRPDNKRQKITSNDIVWAKNTVNKQISTHISVDQLKMVKVMDGFQNPMTHQLEVLGKNMKIPFYSSGNEKPLTPEDRAHMLATTDTVVTFDPETYEEKITVVHNDLNANNIRNLRLVQIWYWDEKKHRLSICLDAVAPLINVMDSEGNFRFQRPLYYRRR